MSYTLITGATSGIGLEMAKLLAAKQQNLIITARHDDKLQSVATMLREAGTGDIKYYAADLAQNGEASRLYQTIIEDGLHVTTLVNNAGVGLYGNFTDTYLADELAMIQLNVGSVVTLTKHFARDMVANGSGRIMNVASLLSFLPFPYYSVYSATKAFILAFSETLAAELEDTGVIVTTLCPGPTDTPFNTDAMWRTNAYKANKPMTADAVAATAVRLLLNGRGKKIVGFNNWFISNLPRITPDKLMMKIKKRLASPASQ
ncbi:MAG: SDR family oxidoreductase [Taibaiella sp.]|nr:SDR family oxidoreductase [Taibaiella sp.]